MSTTENPADIVTRIDNKGTTNNVLWWKGPPFLLNDESIKGEEKIGDKYYAEQVEEEIASLIVETTPTELETKSVIDLNRHSSITKRIVLQPIYFVLYITLVIKRKEKVF